MCMLAMRVLEIKTVLQITFGVDYSYIAIEIGYGFFDLHTVQKSMLYLSGKHISWKKCRQLNAMIFIFPGSKKEHKKKVSCCTRRQAFWRLNSYL